MEDISLKTQPCCKTTQTDMHRLNNADQKTVCTEILHEINKLRLQELFCDSTLLVGGQTFPVHKTILVATSTFFSDLMSAQDNAVYQVNGISPAVFLHILDFLYTGQIALDATNAGLYKSIAQQLKIDTLITICEAFFRDAIEHKAIKKQKQASVIKSARQHSPQKNKTALMKSTFDKLRACGDSLNKIKKPLGMPRTHESNFSEYSKAGSPTKNTNLVEIDDCGVGQNGNLTVDENSTTSAQKSDLITSGGLTDDVKVGDIIPDINKTDDKLTEDFKSSLVCDWCRTTLSTTHALYRHVRQFHRNQMYKCHHCPRQFTSSDMFERHMDHCRLSRKDDDKYHCPNCDYAGKRKTHVVEHFRLEHTNRLRKVCQFCGGVFNGLDRFYEHQLKIHNVDSKNIKRKVHACDQCNFKTLKLHAFKIHRENHVPGKFKCDICSIQCNSEKNLHIHKRNIHNNTLLYKCPICNYTSKYKATLLSHAYRKHQVVSTEKQKIYCCNYCDYSHIDLADFRKHEKHCHSNEKQFQCEQCNKCFKHKTQLHVHERIHNGDRPFLCEQCEYSARSRPVLLAHIRHSHSTEKNYVCHLCGFATKGPSNLLSHKKRCQQNSVQMAPPASAVTVVEASETVNSIEAKVVASDYALPVPEIFQ